MSTDCGYMASADTTWQATWLRFLLDDLQIGLPTNTRYNDDNGCIARSKNPVHFKRSKHIAMRHHILREKVEDNTVKLDCVPFADKFANVLTRALPQPALEQHKEQTGISKYHSPAQGEV